MIEHDSGPVGREGGVDFAAIFASQPTAYLVMSPDLVIVEANRAYLELIGRSREQLIGQYVFDAFPPSPDAFDDAGNNPLQLSFERARDSGLPDQMPLFHYDVLDQETGELAHRAWSLITEPVLDADGRTQLVLQRVEDVSEYVAERQRLAEPVDAGTWARLDGLEADLFARTLELRTAVAAQEKATRRLAGMAQVALQLAASETVEDLTAILAGAGLEALGADGGAIAIHDDRSAVRVTVTQALGKRAQQRLGELGSRLPAVWVARAGTPLLLPDRAAGLAWSPAMAEIYEETGRHAWIAVPLLADDRLLGSLTACWTEERCFPPAEIELVEAFAAQCAQALARLKVLTAERRAAQTSRLVAETLQRSLLTEPQQPDHCQIAVRYLPATGAAAQVGGDWYDAFHQADGALNLVIGDVVGHDINAAAAMGQLRSLLRGVAISGDPQPAHVLDTLDSTLTQLGLDTFATVGIARLERTADEAEQGITRLRWASAGHPPPIVIDRDGRLMQVPEAPGRLMLGVDHSTKRGQTVLQLQPGATVLLYTDGLVEQPGSDLDSGVDRLCGLVTHLAELPLEELCDQILDHLVRASHNDDVALVAVRLNDEPDPASAGPREGPGDILRFPRKQSPIGTAPFSPADPVEQPRERTGPTNRPARTPAQYAEALASWQAESPVPAAAETRLSLQLVSLRALSAVRRQVRTFLSGTLDDEYSLSPADDEAAAEAIDRAILVIDELGSNALRHGTPPASLHLCDEPDRWIIIVSDSAPHRPPTPAIGRTEGQGGYGLYVIADLTGAHGVHYESHLKMVWACVNKPHSDPSRP